MNRWLFAAILCLVAIFATHAKVQATTCTVTFSDGVILHAVQLTNLEACINNIDKQNIGANGINASQIIPTTVGQATFDAAHAYTFLNGIAGSQAFLTGPSPLTLGTDGQAYSGQTFLKVYTATSGQQTEFFNGSGTVNSVVASAFGISTESTNLLTLDRSGNLGVLGSIKARSYYDIVANPSGPYTVPLQVNAVDGGTALPFIVNGPNGHANILINNTAPTLSPAAIGGGQILFANTNNNSGSSTTQLNAGLGGSTPGSYGGYLVIQNKQDGAGPFIENMVFDHNGHVAAMHTNLPETFTTPAGCAALAACGTVDIPFPTAFTAPNNDAENPICTGLLFQDATNPGYIWMGSINALSETGGTYGFGYVRVNYTPTVLTSAADRLTATISCWDSQY